MMWKDLLVEEIHQHRDEYAKKFGYNLHAICQDLRKKQGQNGRRVVSLSPKPVKIIPRVNQAR
jgi:hypothetical protein